MRKLVRLGGVAYSTWAYPSESHISLCPEAIVLPMLESMAPGSTALQRMPSLRNRQATFLVAPICHRVSFPHAYSKTSISILHVRARKKECPPTNPCLEAVYVTPATAPLAAAVLATLTMTPSPFSFMRGSTALIILTGTVKFTAMTRSQTSSLTPSALLKLSITPATLTSTSTLSLTSISY